MKVNVENATIKLYAVDAEQKLLYHQVVILHLIQLVCLKLKIRNELNELSVEY